MAAGGGFINTWGCCPCIISRLEVAFSMAPSDPPPRHHDFSMLSSLNLHKEMLSFQDTNLLNIVLELPDAFGGGKMNQNGELPFLKVVPRRDTSVFRASD